MKIGKTQSENFNLSERVSGKKIEDPLKNLSAVRRLL